MFKCLLSEVQYEVTVPALEDKIVQRAVVECSTRYTRKIF
jgi:hypothetical protein